MNFLSLARYHCAAVTSAEEKKPFHVRLKKFSYSHRLWENSEIVLLIEAGSGGRSKRNERRKIQFVSQILRSRFVVCGEEQKAKIWNFYSAFRSNEMDEPKKLWLDWYASTALAFPKQFTSNLCSPPTLRSSIRLSWGR